MQDNVFNLSIFPAGEIEVCEYAKHLMEQETWDLREFEEHVRGCKTCQAILAEVMNILADAFEAAFPDTDNAHQGHS